MSIIHNNII